MKQQVTTSRKFTKEHEWIQLIDSHVAKVGITDFAQKALGDIVYVEYPEVGQKLAQNKPFGVVESIKSVSDLYSPVDGIVANTNTEITDQWENINNDPYSTWLIELRLDDNSLKSLEDLMDEKAYQEYTQQLE